MTVLEMLSQSGLLTLLGISVVFSFLVILIAFMKLVEILVKVFNLDKEKSSTSSSQNQGGQDTAIIAAIATSIKEKQQ